MISFFVEDVVFKPFEPRKTKLWLKNTILEEGFAVKSLNYIFCSDDYLLDINRQYLDHDYYTDIITFDNSESDEIIEGDIFVSIDRVRENASALNVPFENEFRRVLVHGALHLAGYLDKSPEEEQLMRSKEDYFLSKFN